MQEAKNNFNRFFSLDRYTIINIAPMPYITQNGPNRKLCLLSITPFDINPNIVSNKKPIKL